VDIRRSTIAKLQQLSEPLLQEVSTFIDFVIFKHQAEITNSQPDESLAESWSQWFEAVDSLEITSPESTTSYQQLLLNKYRQKGLDL
jgi:hypothetical protein